MSTTSPDRRPPPKASAETRAKGGRVTRADVIARHAKAEELLLLDPPRSVFISELQTTFPELSRSAALALRRKVYRRWQRERLAGSRQRRAGQVTRLKGDAYRARLAGEFSAVASFERLIMLIEGNAAPTQVEVCDLTGFNIDDFSEAGVSALRDLVLRGEGARWRDLLAMPGMARARATQ